ncbi:MAG TPA: Fe-S protein assembly co-chaperone HscB [Phycisphaerae bacterium]|nr:Fe-S protein assembly co-chaperone HscB [Phycisphaerae bacterium]HOB75520.1 Fe-S protein assembly co-chaperone HscB [Phycisphaerae bacterium]HOJ55889.1 Fe-S protein assembly co-chaperone HscB [Phycisphaerae bacterium]HOL27153.1 Fe-S protein assembly co-chaperone HscB [Phycisphaerae bacterium]HPP21560.1 Fe-S protein assembly co-chaperone HscB [Phycisphaerae bacterium]
MSAPETSSPAVVCSQCSTPMYSPLCCASCGALNPVPPEGLHFNYFELFGLPAAYDLDAAVLHRRYLALSRGVHPDIHGGGSDDQRRQALALSAELNRAYETLRDPVARAEYLLMLAGGPSPAEDKSVPPRLLGEVMTLREELEEAEGSKDAEAMERLRQTIATRRQATMDEIANLCRSTTRDEAIRRQLRKQLNAVKYWNSLLEKAQTTAA